MFLLHHVLPESSLKCPSLWPGSNAHDHMESLPWALDVYKQEEKGRGCKDLVSLVPMEYMISSVGPSLGLGYQKDALK